MIDTTAATYPDTRHCTECGGTGNLHRMSCDTARLINHLAGKAPTPTPPTKQPHNAGPANNAGAFTESAGE